VATGSLPFFADRQRPPHDSWCACRPPRINPRALKPTTLVDIDTGRRGCSIWSIGHNETRAGRRKAWVTFAKHDPFMGGSRQWYGCNLELFFHAVAPVVGFVRFPAPAQQTAATALSDPPPGVVASVFHSASKQDIASRPQRPVLQFCQINSPAHKHASRAACDSVFCSAA